MIALEVELEPKAIEYCDDSNLRFITSRCAEVVFD
jgi:hypothetical protein